MWSQHSTKLMISRRWIDAMTASILVSVETPGQYMLYEWMSLGSSLWLPWCYSPVERSFACMGYPTYPPPSKVTCFHHHLSLHIVCYVDIKSIHLVHIYTHQPATVQHHCSPHLLEYHPGQRRIQVCTADCDCVCCHCHTRSKSRMEQGTGIKTWYEVEWGCRHINQLVTKRENKKLWEAQQGTRKLRTELFTGNQFQWTSKYAVSCARIQVHTGQP